MTDYIDDIIGKGNDASEVMKEACSATHCFQDNVTVIKTPIGDQTVLLPFEGKTLVIDSAGGDTSISSHGDYAASLVDRLVENARTMGAAPIAMTNTLDMSDIELEVVKQAARGLYRAAKKHGIAIINGEIAGLGDRVTVPFNISGTMLSVLDGDFTEGVFSGLSVLCLRDREKYIVMNSDGEGTKTEVAERTGKPISSKDFFAMVLDDQARVFADARAISAVLEASNSAPSTRIVENAQSLADKLGIHYAVVVDNLHGRLSGYGEATYNMGGTAVGFIAPRVAENMPLPKPGHHLVVVQNPNNKNFRSNGFSKIRPACQEMYGPEWHTKEYKGQNLGDIVGAPSTVFYPMIRELQRKNLVSGFYHMSGGAHNGKLAKPLARLGLYAELKKGFSPHPLIRDIQAHCRLSDRKAYEIWGMGNEAYVVTPNHNAVIDFFTQKGFLALDACVLEKRSGKTGVTIKYLSDVHYSGD